MSFFKMRWPDLDMEVRCCSLTENNQAYELFTANLPIKVVQGHEMSGGWMLRDYSVPMKTKPFTLDADTLTEERMCDAPVGRISLLMPRGSMTELLVKYDDCVDTRNYVPVAQVMEEDLPILKKVGQRQWAASTRWKNVIFVEFVTGEG